MKYVALLTAATLLRPGEATPSATMRFMEHLHGAEGGGSSTPSTPDGLYGKTLEGVILPRLFPFFSRTSDQPVTNKLPTSQGMERPINETERTGVAWCGVHLLRIVIWLVTTRERCVGELPCDKT